MIKAFVAESGKLLRLEASLIMQYKADGIARSEKTALFEKAYSFCIDHSTKRANKSGSWGLSVLPTVIERCIRVRKSCRM